MVGALTEVASAKMATPIFVDENELSAERKGLSDYKALMNFPNPWKGGWWRLRNIMDYEMTASLSLLETASRHREDLLRGMYEMASAQMGQYARERAGLTAWEADDLIRLDRELSDLPITFKMYTAGSLGRCKAWQVARAVRLWGSSQTERPWVRYALTHSRRLLEAAVEAAVLLKQADPARWRESKGLPRSGASFPEVLRMCSLSENGDSESMTQMAPLVRIEMRFHPLQKVGYEATVEALRHRYGPDRPEWWCMEVMARHFLEMYAGAGDEVKRTIARQVIQRDVYTCGAPECLMRGGLEADHIKLRPRGGSTALKNGEPALPERRVALPEVRRGGAGQGPL